MLKVGEFYSVLGSGDIADHPAGDPVCFTVLKWASGQENLVDVGHRKDLRGSASVQFWRVWRREGGGEYPPTSMTVFPLAEPDWSLLWPLAGNWTAFRESL
eukprot:10253302-Heterocapsa_arctica.AAC.1